jgi:hypothetical protein
MLWGEVKELAGMLLLLGILVAAGSSVATAVEASEIAEVPAIEQPVEAEVYQAFGSTEPVGSPECG